jgi:hypothetical protein
LCDHRDAGVGTAVIHTVRRAPAGFVTTLPTPSPGAPRQAGRALVSFAFRRLAETIVAAIDRS